MQCITHDRGRACTHPSRHHQVDDWTAEWRIWPMPWQLPPHRIRALEPESLGFDRWMLVEYDLDDEDAVSKLTPSPPLPLSCPSVASTWPLIELCLL